MEWTKPLDPEHEIPTDLLAWLYEYAQSQSPPISIAAAMAQAIEALRDQIDPVYIPSEAELERFRKEAQDYIDAGGAAHPTSDLRANLEYLRKQQ